LWPSATTAALGLTAASPVGETSLSIAALELLAAQTVVELGTAGDVVDQRSLASTVGAAPGEVSSARRDEDVLASAAAFVPAGRRDKFEALYFALGASPAGRTASPAARAARALALAGRGDESISARERAAIAWDVLPVVHGAFDDGQDAPRAEAPLSTGDAAARLVRRRDELRMIETQDAMYVDSRPGLAGLSARAGEALGSYVAPAAAAASPASSRGDVGAVLRAPSAAPELVQTGPGSGRYGGGETEIPSWFEEAARKMLGDRTGATESFSLAELTLVTAAPSAAIAASTRSAGSHAAPTSATPSPGQSGAAGAAGEKVDIEKVANEVYREVLVLMDIARARNGEPYL
jgi:hypothetical protein